MLKLCNQHHGGLLVPFINYWVPKMSWSIDHCWLYAFPFSKLWIHHRSLTILLTCYCMNIIAPAILMSVQNSCATMEFPGQLVIFSVLLLTIELSWHGCNTTHNSDFSLSLSPSIRTSMPFGPLTAVGLKLFFPMDNSTDHILVKQECWGCYAFNAGYLFREGGREGRREWELNELDNLGVLPNACLLNSRY